MQQRRHNAAQGDSARAAGHTSRGGCPGTGGDVAIGAQQDRLAPVAAADSAAGADAECVLCEGLQPCAREALRGRLHPLQSSSRRRSSCAMQGSLAGCAPGIEHDVAAPEKTWVQPASCCSLRRALRPLRADAASPDELPSPALLPSGEQCSASEAASDSRELLDPCSTALPLWVLPAAGSQGPPAVRWPQGAAYSTQQQNMTSGTARA